MEENIIVQSKQYEIKKFCKIFCSIVLVVSVAVTIGLFFSYCAMNNNIAKSNYENHYLPKRQKIINEYNDIVKKYETTDAQSIECYHAKKTKSSYKGVSYMATLLMTEEEFLKNHPSFEKYV